MKHRLVLALVAAFTATTLEIAAAPAGPVITAIEVENLSSIPLDESAVLAFITSRQGETFSRARLAADIRALKDSGLFSLVQAAAEEAEGGLRLIYRVKPRPRLRKLEVVGARRLSANRIKRLLRLEPGQPVDDAVLGTAVVAVRDAYRKKYITDVKLNWEMETIPGTALADVVLRVREGKPLLVRRILFRGNRVLSARRLRAVMNQKAVDFMSWITRAGVFDEDLLADDQERIRRVYLDAGYLDAEVSEPVITQKGRYVAIAFEIKEGNPYRVGEVSVEGASVFSATELVARARLPRGEVAGYQKLERAADRIAAAYQDQGYLGTRVSFELKPRPDGIVDVIFKVEEGQKVFVRNIYVSGNTRTKDKVIRRELAIYPGEVFNERRVRLSERRLMNLGYFSSVHGYPTPTDRPDQYDLTFAVEEQETGQLMLGAGFSSVDRLVGFLELSQGNFDLFGWPYFTGGGQKLKLRLQAGSKRNDVELTFVEPWFLDRRLALSIGFFRHDRRFLSDDYDQRNIGGNLGLTWGLGQFLRLGTEYSLEEIEVYDVASDASELIKQEEGRRTKSAVSLFAVRDTRDKVFVPTRGNRTRLSVTVAGGPLGGDTDIYELQLRTAQYFPLWLDHVLSIRGMVAVVEEYGDSDRVPIFDRLFLGGAHTVRGFRYRDVGPKDETGEPVGGKSAAFVSVEYSVPVAEKLRLAAFYDAGMVWPDAYEFDTELNSSFGVGIRLDMPRFPLRLDYAWPIETDEFNDQPSGRLSFVLGYSY